ncbi:MAG: glycosyltransferase [Pseudomonadota bacterium]
MTISIIIKALNEEDRIASAIEHAMQAARPHGGEVILADSGSTDKTITIAQNYPITIVQLTDPRDQRCGTGPELGYRHANHPFIAITDGDMELSTDFVHSALSFLRANRKYGGVSGTIDEKSLDQLEYQRRAQRQPKDMQAGDVDRLNGGDVFRRSAVKETGYLTDRNLHAYEEYDLALRFRHAEWKLARLPETFVQHYGHRTNPYRLLLRRLTSGYLYGVGEVTRAHITTERRGKLLRDLREVWLWSAIIAKWLFLLAVAFVAPSISTAALMIAVLLLAPIPIMAWRYKSLSTGVYAVCAWHLHAYGFLRGLLAPRRAPRAQIDHRIIKAANQPHTNTATTPDTETQDEAKAG